LSGYLRDSGVEGLRVLTAGPVPPNPQELLGSQRMVELLRALERQSDIVVVDTPPVLVVSDANVLATRTDGVLVVVNTGGTRRTAIQQTVEDLRKVGANVLGGVLNMVDSRDGRGYYYYYSYYYSHYYGNDDGDEKRGLGGRLRRLGKRSGGRRAQPSPTQSRN
jgi:capsular exopolysaccharide synthesis family protein